MPTEDHVSRRSHASPLPTRRWRACAARPVPPGVARRPDGVGATRPTDSRLCSSVASFITSCSPWGDELCVLNASCRNSRRRYCHCWDNLLGSRGVVDHAHCTCKTRSRKRDLLIGYHVTSFQCCQIGRFSTNWATFLPELCFFFLAGCSLLTNWATFELRFSKNFCVFSGKILNFLAYQLSFLPLFLLRCDFQNAFN